MVRRVSLMLLVLVALVGAPLRAADRWWVGGGVGLAFGTVDFVSIEPVVGYSATERLGLGGRLIYRYRSDDRFSPELSSTDYGASVFGRYFVARPAYLQLEYEYLSYEFAFTDGSTERDEFGSVLGGVGMSQPIGDRSSFFVLALYNFSYSEGERSPYSEPWIVRAGVGFAF